MMEYKFKVNLKVRSYECDPQGIVNNAVYLQYLEHARCEWLKTMGLNYAQMSAAQQYLVVSKMEINFKSPLVYDDDFWVGGNVWRESNIHLRAQQDIYRQDNLLILAAKVDVVGFEGRDHFGLPQIIINTYPKEPVKLYNNLRNSSIQEKIKGKNELGIGSKISGIN
jgi:acyl-CoA thioester hydrolase